MLDLTNTNKCARGIQAFLKSVPRYRFAAHVETYQSSTQIGTEVPISKNGWDIGIVGSFHSPMWAVPTWGPQLLKIRYKCAQNTRKMTKFTPEMTKILPKSPSEPSIKQPYMWARPRAHYPDMPTLYVVDSRYCPT